MDFLFVRREVGIMVKYRAFIVIQITDLPRFFFKHNNKDGLLCQLFLRREKFFLSTI